MRRWRPAFLQPLIIIAARRFLNVTFKHSRLCGVSAALLALEAPRTTTAAAKEQSASIRLFHLLPDGRISFPALPLTVLHLHLTSEWSLDANPGLPLYARSTRYRKLGQFCVCTPTSSMLAVDRAARHFNTCGPLHEA